jgi:hypothetical protein
MRSFVAVSVRGTRGVAAPSRWSRWLPTRALLGWSLGGRPRHSPRRGTPASRDRRISRDAVAEWSVSSSGPGRPCEAFLSEDRSARVRRARITPRATWWWQADALGYRLRVIRRGPSIALLSCIALATEDGHASSSGARGRRSGLGSGVAGLTEAERRPPPEMNRSDHWERLWITPVGVPECPPPTPRRRASR